GRQILKPVAPSKRSISERPPQSSGENCDIANAFLPRELADIIASRQRRERAWHARILICTSMISSIDSTLANFTEEIEIDEVLAFKAYLRRAIANFAATDSSPSLPLIPSHTHPSRSNGNLMSTNKNGKNTKKVMIATPHIVPNSAPNRRKTQEVVLPKIPQSYEKTWATVAQNGQKKARVAVSNKIQAAPHTKVSQRQPAKDKPTTSGSDKRIFVRIPEDHEWRKLSPAGMREVVVKKLSISPSLIGRIKPVHSGFALSPCSTEAREAILKAGNGLFLSGAKLESATNWVPVIIPTVPSSIRKEHGDLEVNSSMLADEVERVCSVRPAHLKLYGRNNSEAPHRTWMAFFSKAPRAGFRVFDESGIARPFKKRQPLEFCKRCNGHHPTKNCSRAPSCGNCGSTNHSEDLCMAKTKCRNCGGPHRSDSRRCLARPTRLGAPTKEQMKAYRQAGEREYQAVLRAKAAEEAAASTENINIEIISSQCSEPNSNFENSQASPVVQSTGDASCL
ncbi:hypothetical protein EPUL_006813, partial [Erysiphe pulchra]